MGLRGCSHCVGISQDILGHPRTDGTTWTWDSGAVATVLGYSRTSQDILGHPRTDRTTWTWDSGAVATVSGYPRTSSDIPGQIGPLGSGTQGARCIVPGHPGISPDNYMSWGSHSHSREFCGSPGPHSSMIMQFYY